MLKKVELGATSVCPSIRMTGRRSSFRETMGIIRVIQRKDESALRSASEEHIRKSFEEIMGTF